MTPKQDSLRELEQWLLNLFMDVEDEEFYDLSPKREWYLNESGKEIAKAIYEHRQACVEEALKGFVQEVRLGLKKRNLESSIRKHVGEIDTPTIALYDAEDIVEAAKNKITTQPDP